MTELFHARNLGFRFRDGIEGLKGIDCTIREGEFVVIAGRNGSGKTLFARHLAGLQPPGSGSLEFRGVALPGSLPRLRRAVGLVFQDTDSQILGQTVEEDVAFGPSNLGLLPQEIQQRTAEALAGARLEHALHRRPETLSGGEKRRLSIAGILAMRPECIILDEPFANLDMESVNDVASLCRDLASTGMTLIVVTHELEKILGHATRLLVLDGGRLVFDGPPINADPELFVAHGLACPWEGHFPWIMPRPQVKAAHP